MDSGKRLFKAFLGKMPESQPSQENGQPSAPPSPAVARGPPGAPSSSRQVLQTRDRVKLKRAVASGPPGSSLETPETGRGGVGGEGPLALREGRTASHRKQVLGWGPCRASAFSSQSPGWAPRWAWPLLSPTAVGSAPLPANPTPGTTERRDPSQGELCPQSRDGVLLTGKAGSRQGDLSTRVWPKCFWRLCFETAAVWRGGQWVGSCSVPVQR